MMRVAILVVGVAVIAGCTTMTPEERRAADEATCRGYGFRAGTTAFAECLQREDLDRRAAMRAALDRVDRDPFPMTRVVYVPAPRL